jgi:type II secretory pathway component GspD/PulD (secretin)
LQQADNRNLTTMPLLGHLPLVGRLFHNHDDADNRTELIITITAKIVEKGDFNVNSRSPGTEQGKYRYLFHDLEEITRRVLFIDEVVDL